MIAEYFGRGSLAQLREILQSLQVQRVFLVRNGASYELSGARQVLEPILAPYHVTEFHDFEANPKLEDTKRGIEIFRESGSDVVVAIGGGSVIDMAKLMNALGTQPQEAEEYIVKKSPLYFLGKPLIAIPTTSGTGTEATCFAVVYIDKTKYSLKHPSILPTYVIIDPTLTHAMPPSITAATGMDALSQAIESYWCVNSTPESQAYAREAITLTLTYLKAACQNESEARDAMSRAANLAGKAINLTETTACHAVSYPITSYFNVPHGHAVALTLASMFGYNAAATETDILDARGTTYLEQTMGELVALLGARDQTGAEQVITTLMESIGLATRLSRLGIDESGMDIIIKNGFNPDRVKNNPRLLTADALRGMLNRLL